MIDPVLERADRENPPCFLWTNSETNERIYVKIGFEAARRLEVLGVTTYGMLRQPR